MNIFERNNYECCSFKVMIIIFLNMTTSCEIKMKFMINVLIRLINEIFRIYS